MNKVRQSFLLFLAVAAILSTGCNYMHHRGEDAMRIVDLGITVTPHLQPNFEVYCGFVGALPFGVSYMDDAKLLGIGNNQAGYLDYENKSWGVGLWGSSKQGAGEFDSKDPYQARADQADLTERPRFNMGPVAILAEGNGPSLMGYAECDKGVHIGWIGLVLNCRPVALIDFLVGWSTFHVDGHWDSDEPVAAKK